MEIRGVRLKKVNRYSKNSGFYVLRDPECFSVPLLSSSGDQSARIVNVGGFVKEGTVIANPVGKYGSYVFSPCSGKVIGVVRKLNASGNECEHVIIARDMQESKEFLPVLDEKERVHEKLLKRLYESGMVDSFEPFDPSYKKYLLKCKIESLIINCTEADPYKTSDSALIETYYSEVVEGAKLLQKTGKAESILFVFTTKQKAIAKIVKNHVKKLGETKNIKIKIYPNIYPLHDGRLMAYYNTGKMVPEGVRTAETKVIVDSPSNCYDFYNAVEKGIPSIQKAVTVAGNNCLRKANYFIKNGTNIEHILHVVGTKQEYSENMLIYGGIMTGVAQETLDISTTLTASCILFCDKEEYSRDQESPCIGCGRCVACCPVKLHVKNLDEAIINREFSKTKKLGVTACIECGVCSFVCPAKRYLTQRICYAKDLAYGRRAKNPESSQFLVVDGEGIDKRQVKEDKILQASENFELPQDKGDKVPEIDEMLKILDKHTNEDKGGENNE